MPAEPVLQVKSFRARLQFALVGIGLAAIAVTGSMAVEDAADALSNATYQRLTAIRETKKRQIERYFSDLASHVIALSSDESTTEALLAFRASWDTLPPMASGANQRLQRFYAEEAAPLIARDLPPGEFLRRWLPRDPRQQSLQDSLIARNPHPLGAKDLLVDVPELGAYGRIHQRYHPSLHRYLNSFGFYDIFLIDATDGRILYSVYKEIDLGASLRQQPWAESALASVFRKALDLRGNDTVAVEDYSPYIASHFAPAAFLAAPVRRAGIVVGVLAIQVAVGDVNRMITADRSWQETGFGNTGHAYIVGKDLRLRSDIRIEMEHLDVFLEQLASAGVEQTSIERIRRDGTGVLTLRASPDLARWVQQGVAVTGLGRDFRNVEVLRSFAPLNVPGMEWYVVADLEAAEAFAPVAALRVRILVLGGIVAFLFFVAAWLLARRVTDPVRRLALSTRRLGRGDFSTRLSVESDDELGDLATSFNRMAEDLERSTVSRSRLDEANQQLRAQQKELESLAARLIGAQEDERSRIARELHDDFTQRLAAVAIELGRIERAAANQPMAEQAKKLRETMARISSDVHRLSRSLHPSMLKELGLRTALSQEMRAFFDRGGPPVELHMDGDWDDIPETVQLALYRLVQEALQNAIRHADAEEVTVSLYRRGKQVVLRVEDDGRGFDRGAPGWQPGLGLASMRERVHLLGGDFEILSALGQGTVITAKLPLAPPPREPVERSHA
jgi:signal transduction histidine kinase